jgi:hypothetical protein
MDIPCSTKSPNLHISLIRIICSTQSDRWFDLIGPDFPAPKTLSFSTSDKLLSIIVDKHPRKEGSLVMGVDCFRLRSESYRQLQSKDIYERLMRPFDGVARNPLAVVALSRLRSKVKSMRSILVT